ncbi:MAG: hypothetical protein ACO1OK_04300 [Devosia sp.]
MLLLAFLIAIGIGIYLLVTLLPRLWPAARCPLQRLSGFRVRAAKVAPRLG